MRAEARNEFPIVRRGYDTVRVDDFVDAAAADLARLAGENRDLHRRLTLDATGRGTDPGGVPGGVPGAVPGAVGTALDAARAELERMVDAALAERNRARVEAEQILDDARLERERVVLAARDGANQLTADARLERNRLIAVAADEAERIVHTAEAARAGAVDEAAAARADRARLVEEIEAARAELDRLVRARVEVRRELSALAEAVRNWLGSTTGTLPRRFVAPPERALRPPLPPPAIRLGASDSAEAGRPAPGRHLRSPDAG